jgi:hypothetical protein
MLPFAHILHGQAPSNVAVFDAIGALADPPRAQPVAPPLPFLFRAFDVG